MSLVGASLIVVAVVWGAGAGVLLPRAAYRLSVPHGDAGAVLSAVSAPSEGVPDEVDDGWRTVCPRGHRITGPLRGWLGRARCDACAGASYGPSALALALLTAFLCAALAAATGPRPELAVWLLLTPVGVLLTVVDLRVHRLPDVLTLPLAAAALVLLGLAALAPGDAGDWSTALLGTLGLGGGYYVLCRINPAGMGFGDVKLALGAGAALGWYGWSTVLLGTAAAFLLGALYAGVLVALRRAGRRTAIAFGPFLLAGAFLGVLNGAYTA